MSSALSLKPDASGKAAGDLASCNGLKRLVTASS
jgi:hypothetical protein